MSSVFFDLIETGFTTIARISVEATLLALVILAVQFVFKKHLAPRWRYALWALLLVRLVLPTLPESGFSLQRLLPTASLGLSRDALAQPSQNPGPAVSTLPFAPAEKAIPLTHTFSHPLTLTSGLALIWLIGVVTLSSFFLALHLRFLRALRLQPFLPPDQPLLDTLNSASKEMGLRKSPGLLVTTMVSSPAVCGIFKPVLLLPENFVRSFSPREQRVILLHELAHIRRRDIWTNHLLAILQIIHWFNPMLWIAFNRIRLDRECATDSLVLSGDRGDLKQLYANTLLKLVESAPVLSMPPRLLGVLENKNHLKERFRGILHAHPRAYGWSFLGFLLLAVLGITTLTKPASPKSPSSVPASSNPDSTQLPPNASKDQVRTYVRNVLNDTSRFASSSLSDPQIKELKKVGPENIDILIEENERVNLPLSITANSNINYYLSMTVCALARPQDRDLVLKGLPKNRYLIYTVVKMKWAPECREELLQVFREEPGQFAPGWIEAIASLHDPSTYEELKNYLITGNHREHTYKALQTIPDIGDLKETVEKAWPLAKNAGSYEARDMAKIAAGYGVADAITYQQSHPDSSAMETPTPSPPPSPDPTQAVMAGLKITQEDAEKLVREIAANPDNFELRLKLCGYYFLKRSQDAAARDAVQPHILWIIQHHPESPAAGTPFVLVLKRQDPVHYAEALAAWKEALTAQPKNPSVLGNAAAFMQLADPLEAGPLLEQARSLEPANTMWSQRIAEFLTQQAQSVNRLSFPNARRDALAAYETAIQGQEGEKLFYVLTSVPMAAYHAGNNQSARDYAHQLLGLAPSFHGNWNYGNAIYSANSVLGLVALQEGKTGEAEKYLLAAGDTPGSPQLDSFGPDLTLAQKLLETGQRETVVTFLGKIKTFWEGHETQIQNWQIAIRKGETAKLARTGF